MPRRKTSFNQDNFYHIYNRGALRRSLFIEETNYRYIIRRIKECAAACQLTCAAYCLLPNHYHLLVRQDGEIPVSELPKRLFGGYSRAVNNRYGWEGTIFEGRFKDRQVTDEDYLRHLCRYIHANPVKHGLVDDLEAWPWSNYLAWIRQSEDDTTPDPLISALLALPPLIARLSRRIWSVYRPRTFWLISRNGISNNIPVPANLAPHGQLQG